jgi:hypothetical protein
VLVFFILPGRQVENKYSFTIATGGTLCLGFLSHCIYCFCSWWFLSLNCAVVTQSLLSCAWLLYRQYARLTLADNSYLGLEQKKRFAILFILVNPVWLVLMQINHKQLLSLVYLGMHHSRLTSWPIVVCIHWCQGKPGPPKYLTNKKIQNLNFSFRNFTPISKWLNLTWEIIWARETAHLCPSMCSPCI